MPLVLTWLPALNRGSTETPPELLLSLMAAFLLLWDTDPSPEAGSGPVVI